MTDEAHTPPAALGPGASPYKRHVFVCTHGKVCPEQGAKELQLALKLATRKVLGPIEVRVNKSGCVSQCGYGPMVVVYPDNVWYAGVTEGDVPEIVQSHLIDGRPVERLLYRGHVPGKNIRAVPDC